MFKKSIIAAIAALFTIAGANADLVDLSGSTSEGLFGEDSNTVVIVNLDGGEGATVIGFAWALSFEAFAPSWGSEARIDVTAPDGTLFTFNGGVAGWGEESGIFIDGGDINTFNGVAYTGDWTFRFYESFNDGSTDPDGIYNEAVFLIKPVPAPATLALLGAAGLIGRRRRRA